MRHCAPALTVMLGGLLCSCRRSASSFHSCDVGGVVRRRDATIASTNNAYSRGCSGRSGVVVVLRGLGTSIACSPSAMCGACRRLRSATLSNPWRRDWTTKSSFSQRVDNITAAPHWLNDRWRHAGTNLEQRLRGVFSLRGSPRQRRTPFYPAIVRRIGRMIDLTQCTLPERADDEPDEQPAGMPDDRHAGLWRKRRSPRRPELSRATGACSRRPAALMENSHRQFVELYSANREGPFATVTTWPASCRTRSVRVASSTIRPPESRHRQARACEPA